MRHREKEDKKYEIGVGQVSNTSHHILSSNSGQGESGVQRSIA